VVGYGDNGAFLYSGGVMTDLNSLLDQHSRWTSIQPYAINDRGQITGEGIIGGQTHAFLLTPTPEPSSIVLAAFGFAGLERFQLVCSVVAAIAIAVFTEVVSLASCQTPLQPS
jgi:hypothetical protein